MGDRKISAEQPNLWLWEADQFNEVQPGYRRRIITGDEIMVCFWRIDGGSGPTPYGNHPDNEQFGIVLRGQLHFRINSSEKVVLKPGDIYWAPKGCDHGDSTFVGDEEYGETWIVDVFAPPRDDYRDG